MEHYLYANGTNWAEIAFFALILGLQQQKYYFLFSFFFRRFSKRNPPIERRKKAANEDKEHKLMPNRKWKIPLDFFCRWA